MLSSYFGEFSAGWTILCTESSLLVVTGMTLYLLQKHILVQHSFSQDLSGLCFRGILFFCYISPFSFLIYIYLYFHSVRMLSSTLNHFLPAQIVLNKAKHSKQCLVLPFLYVCPMITTLKLEYE